jgi:opacity protein-like surface antigen
MKRILVLILAFSFCIPLYVYAASIGEVETVGQNKFSIGVNQEFVFNRDMKLDKSWYWSMPAGRNIDVKEKVDSLYRTMGKVSYGLLDNLDVYVKLGVSDFKTKNSYSETGAGLGDDVGTIKLNGKNAFAWGVGTKGTIALAESWIIGCDIQYLNHKNKLKGRDSWTQYNPDGSIFEIDGDDITGNVTFHEWHVAPYVAYKIGNFVPYVGGKYSDMRMHYKTKYVNTAVTPDDNKPKFKADDNVGIFCGMNYNVGQHLMLNVEGRFIDETAMSFGASYRF